MRSCSMPRKRRPRATEYCGYEIQDCSSGKDVLTDFTPEVAQCSRRILAAAAAVGRADCNIETGGDPVPVVTHLRLAAGRNFMTAGDGARDLTGLAVRARRRRLLAGRRHRLRIDLHRLRGGRRCEARRTKSDRQTRTEQKWFHFQLNAFGSLLQAKRAKSRRVPQMA